MKPTESRVNKQRIMVYEQHQYANHGKAMSKNICRHLHLNKKDECINKNEATAILYLGGGHLVIAMDF